MKRLIWDLFFGSSVYKGPPSVHGLIVLLRRAVKRAAVQPEKGPFLWGGGDAGVDPIAPRGRQIEPCQGSLAE